MPRKRSEVLTDHELRLMEALWRLGKATVAEVTASIGRPRLAYNTVLSTLRTLETKGYVGHAELGRAFVYHPVVGRGEAVGSAIRQVVRRFFDSPGKLAVALIDDVAFSEADLSEIRRALARKRKGRR